MGAFFFALGLCLSMACVQILVYVLSIYSMPVFVLLLIPLWILFGFLMRKAWMMHRVRRIVRRTPRQSQPDTETEPASEEPPVSKTPEEEYLTLKKLPDDTPFETDEPVIKNPFTGETF